MRSASLIFALISSVISSPCIAQSTPVPPALEYMFTASVNVDKPLTPSGTKTIAGGIEIFEPITGGNITGPVINGTIFGGAAYPVLYNNQTLETPGLLIYGNTTDGYSYVARGEGVGVPADQFVRLTLDINGPYACLASSFIVAELLPNKEKTVVTVHGFKVPLSVKS
ncbi:hypothetical protein MMC10_003617 [Thelotrema lepadinum]|nr:hypothetical protein [Thelotrema lepadinum]